MVASTLQLPIGPCFYSLYALLETATHSDPNAQLPVLRKKEQGCRFFATSSSLPLLTSHKSTRSEASFGSLVTCSAAEPLKACGIGSFCPACTGASSIFSAEGGGAALDWSALLGLSFSKLLGIGCWGADNGT